MNLDISVAPEIAQLAQPRPWPRVPPPAVPATHAAVADAAATHAAVADGPAQPAPTLGALSRELARLAATPQRWWDLVRFDPERPVRVPLQAEAGHEAWLLVMPPGGTTECACRLATLIAGEAAEESAGGPGAAPLRPGRTMVHGGRPRAHAILGAGHGYSVSLHVGAATARSV
ncbi:MAG: hypothetical protein JOY82_10830 [Streptosporangiaceae bacterium]|nr:hypothetical protein [Streptosporangiaceae bacterium]MBV9854996.1 hypothetical protein [Streptosporangiaceae bacterium]